ncbi:hypothetical protein [Rhizobium sp. CF080]|uniref:hypothetical protein n=1 Tax=Rhizobium sp. (strain CF080) TaxID=1144310 RepID=UPI0012DDAD24|nr:hypothetical protein [Rhizobium sp. CF080]
MILTISDVAAFYAAIVATGALFLEVRRWFESGVRLRVSASHQYDMPEMRHHIIAAEVSSIGDTPTTITGLDIWGYPSVLHALFGLSRTRLGIFDTTTFATPKGLPYQLAPGDLWSGGLDFNTRELSDPRFAIAYFAVKTTRFDSPTFRRIKM